MGTTVSTEGTEGKGDAKPNEKEVELLQQRDMATSELGKLRKTMAELQPKVLSDDDLALFSKLKDQQAKAEEERAKKAGEFETLKQQLAKKHQDELAERETRLSTLSQRFKDTVIKAEFGAASDWFNGTDSSKTILDVDLGMSAFAKYVHVEDADNDPRGYRVIVKSPKGDTIVGKDGNPAPFSDAIGELIAQLPNKDRILRGSGKTGSGSSGGSTGSQQPVDLRNLTAAQLKDPKVIAALQALGGSSGVQMGTSFQK
jgi:hypothetical protein